MSGAGQGPPVEPGKIFAALADDTRRGLLSMLVDQPQSASGLSRQIGISRQAVAKHLASLQAASLVAPVRAGREVHFVVQPHSLAPAQDWIDSASRSWNARLDKLEDQLGD